MAPPDCTLCSNDKAVGSSKNTTQNLLPADSPAWGIALYELLNTVIIRSQKEVNQQISDLINISIKYVHDLATNKKTEIEALSNTIDTLNDVIECVKEQNNKQQHHILKNETYSRRNNILFRDFDSTEDPCDVIVRRILSKTWIQGVERIQFVRCHYLEGRNQIIARF